MTRLYTFDEAVKLATEIGIQAGIDYIQKEKENKRKSRYDRRLRNTKLLLKEYRKLIIHSKDAVYSNHINAIDVLDDLDDFEYEDILYIESILKSKERTAIIIEHIEKMVKIYKYICYKGNKPEERRRYDVVFDMYIRPKEIPVEEISSKYSIDTSTVYRDVNKAIESLAALIFGIDGLKIE